MPSPIDYKEFSKALLLDKELLGLTSCDKSLKLNFVKVLGMDFELFYERDISQGRYRPYVPPEFRHRILDTLRSFSHPGVQLENLGESILYQWIVKIQDFIEELEDNNLDTKSTRNCDSNIPVAQEIDTCNMQKEELPTVYHGETIVDRKSVFQGHAATVVSLEQAKKVLIELKKNKKIVNATHNIMAYRIINDSNLVIQDCDDDGESRGGSTLLHLLQILDVKNVIVVVSRWYGGIHLGSDRFKHISNAARMVLTSSGYITEKNTEKKKHKKR
ncbi:protein IMPACT [Trichonephila inaurata madagascariensis]|uniref:Protein IMPACT n=1 Tax=Trichonephila inaurata madagascariensis TaxID=2747483 RepID=A0A8X7BZ89_9ARAC|nr:protein IMPACT [Trichonephila inaurata madagascariensis]